MSKLKVSIVANNLAQSAFFNYEKSILINKMLYNLGKKKKRIG
jgi:hypothetical protein